MKNDMISVTGSGSVTLSQSPSSTSAGAVSVHYDDHIRKRLRLDSQQQQESSDQDDYSHSESKYTSRPHTGGSAGPGQGSGSDTDQGQIQSQENPSQEVQGGQSEKQKRSSTCCDLCRKRKVRCIKEDGDGRCKSCTALHQPCIATPRERPGRRSKFALKTTPSPSPSSAAPIGEREISTFPFPDGPHSVAPIPIPISHHHHHNHHHHPSPTRQSPMTSLPSLDKMWLSPASEGLFSPLADTFLQRDGSTDPNPLSNGNGNGNGWNNNRHQQWDGSSSSTVSHNIAPQRPTLPSFSSVNLTLDQGGGRYPLSSGSSYPLESQGDHSLPASQLPAMDRFHSATTPAAVKLDDVVDLGTVMRILQSYRTHLYALMPIIHWPTFLQLVAAREDERVLHFRAFLFSLIAYTVIQLPRSALTFLPVPVLRQLHQRCYSASKSLLDLRQENVRATLLEVSTLYCHHIYLSTIDDVDRARGVLAQAIRLAQVLNLHNESTVVADVIEAEIRRRVFWLLYSSDQTMSAYSSLPPLIQTIDIAVPLPAIVDDNHISASGSMPANESAPLLSGFHFNARLFRIIGDIHTAKRDLKGIPTIQSRLPVGIGAFHLPPPQHFLNQLDHFIWDLPPRLRPVSVMPTQDSLDLSAQDVPSPQVEEGNREDDHGFATCRTNLLVTLALTRYMVRQYALLLGKDELNSREANAHWAEDHIISLLKRMPPDSLVANGEALRHKLLHLAFALLETFPASSESHTFLSDSVEVLSRISREQLAGLLEPTPLQ